jgi:hypothetical protein
VTDPVGTSKDSGEHERPMSIEASTYGLAAGPVRRPATGYSTSKEVDTDGISG